MIGYFLRLLCVSLASFFLLHLLFGLVLLGSSPFLLRRTHTRKPHAAARLLLWARLAPLALSLFTLMALCIPSYLRFEHDAAEDVAWPCLLLAFAALALLFASCLRALRVLAPSSPFNLAPQTASETAPLLALAGILHPRVIVSPRVRQCLDPHQMEAALQHEEAHRRAHDNLKRTVLFLAPGLLPFHRGFRSLEHTWSRLTEWAADDAASAAHPLRALALAEALVRVARLAPCPQHSPALSELVPSPEDLTARIHRLLACSATSEPIEPPPTPTAALLPRSILSAGLALFLLLCLQPHTLFLVHALMERLVH